MVSEHLRMLAVGAITKEARIVAVTDCSDI